MVVLCGCTSVEPTLAITTLPTPVTVTATYIVTDTPTETPGPAPTPNYDSCFDKNITTPYYCYDRYYWVRPIVTPAGMGYTAKVWKNDSCVDLNRTSGECEGWGDNTWVTLFLHNLTVVKNLTSINNTEMVAAVTYYNQSFDLNVINDHLAFSDFINIYCDKTYPSQPYDKNLFAPETNVIVVPIDTFNPDAF
jgi:hypothetical protein